MPGPSPCFYLKLNLSPEMPLKRGRKASHSVVEIRIEWEWIGIKYFSEKYNLNRIYAYIIFTSLIILPIELQGKLVTLAL